MLRDLSDQDLISWPDDCPDDCECTCVSDDDEFHVKVDCSGRGLQKVPEKLPIRTRELYLQDNFLTNPLNFDKGIFGDLVSLDLERNLLQSLDFYLPENLTVLKLASNNLTRFFNSEPSENIQIWSLSDNPWICDCETRDFKNWMISQKTKIVDVNETRCSFDTEDEGLRDQIIVFLNEAQLCPTSVSTIVVITVGLLISVLAITSTILLHSKYRYHLKVWLYSRGLTWLKKAEDQDFGKLHDAYISAAEEDLHLIVRYLIPELEEKDPYYSLYIPGRDMLGGEFEIDKQMEEVKKSKRLKCLKDSLWGLNHRFLPDSPEVSQNWLQTMSVIHKTHGNLHCLVETYIHHHRRAGVTTGSNGQYRLCAKLL
ncbi:protein toll-like [Uloborus diversus]|uniref:protein toll-like n=1 Tax=Uloborus diversus TaxID=327109 RepID=UPI0024092D8B|nr:protein toll-like [Uloborus diversus]